MSPEALVAAWSLTFALHGAVLCALAAGLAAAWPRLGSAGIWRTAVFAALATSTLQVLLAPHAIDLTHLWAQPAQPVDAVLSALPDGSPEPAAVALPAAAPVAWRLETVVSLAALAFAALGLGVLWHARRRMVALLATRQPERSARVLAAAAEVAAAVGLRSTPRLSRCAGLPMPVAFGFLRPEICLPTATDGLDDDALRAMLAHELAHLRHGDAFWLWGGALLQALFPWHLPLRLARRRLHHAVELRCDAEAAQRAGGLAVANCLVEVAAWVRGSARPPLGALTMAARPSALRARVEAALAAAEGPPPRPVARQSAFACLAVVLLVAAVPGVRLSALPVVAEDMGDAAANDADVDAGLAVQLRAVDDEIADLRRQVAALHSAVADQAAADPELTQLLSALAARLQRLDRVRAALGAMAHPENPTADDLKPRTR